MKKFFKKIQLPVFLLGLILVVLIVLEVFTVSNGISHQSFMGFYLEDTKLDAVYIGSSTTYSFWQGPFGWEKFGFAVYPLATPSMSSPALKYVIEEARKTQPDALYILNLNTFKKTQCTVQQVHYAADYMPLSRNKITMVRELCKTFGVTGMDTLEYFLPVIRFHSGWDDLSKEAVYHPPEKMKGAVHYYSFLQKSTDVSAEYAKTEDMVDMTEEQVALLSDLLQYCKDNELNVLFVAVPQSGKSEELLGQYNTMAQFIQDAGYPVLNLTKSMDAPGLDPAHDYYNNNHVNIHGCVKYMDYLGAYLREHYGFEDKRGDPAYASWDRAVEKYNQTVAPYSLDFERIAAARDLSLPRSELTGLTADAGAMALTWDGQAARDAGADGWLVYRKAGKTDAWQQVAELDAGTQQFTDSDVLPGTKYSYTVVSVRHEGGDILYGNYDYAGLSASLSA